MAFRCAGMDITRMLLSCGYCQSVRLYRTGAARMWCFMHSVSSGRCMSRDSKKCRRNWRGDYREVDLAILRSTALTLAGRSANDNTSIANMTTP